MDQRGTSSNGDDGGDGGDSLERLVQLLFFRVMPTSTSTTTTIIIFIFGCHHRHHLAHSKKNRTTAQRASGTMYNLDEQTLYDGDARVGAVRVVIRRSGRVRVEACVALLLLLFGIKKRDDEKRGDRHGHDGPVG